MKKPFPASLILIMLISSCTVGPVYSPPLDETPAEWHSHIPATMDTCSAEDLVWWESLQDPLLNQLIECAAAQNLDLQIAAARVLKARTEANGKKGDLYPHIDGSVSGGHVYYSKDALINGLLGTTIPSKCRRKTKRHVNYFEIGFDVQWEIDLFGMTKHEIAALKAQEEAVQEGLCSIWVTLSAEIAKNYIELRSLQSRLDILQRTIKAQAEAIVLSQELLSRGVVNEMDLYKAEAECSVLRAQSPLMELGVDRAIHRISILLGYVPGELYECLNVASTLPKLPEKMPIGMPSELLRRRPDIRKAERELAVATERVGSAVAGLFPRFSLNGFLGEISAHAGSLFTPASAAWLAGPQLLIPIFNSRLLLQDVEYNKIATQEALFNYQKVVLEALEESENAIASYRYESERLNNLVEAYYKYHKTELLARKLYEEGVHDNLMVIGATKSLLSSEDILLQSQTSLLLNYVSLYKSLGGTWR
ncbi:MAG: efflux transporter outer membrane subunit [Parachlamydiaceae bacterium]|nr:efflux transporter outer membrane subunit [Parachlamydiaceae bacterium]